MLKFCGDVGFGGYCAGRQIESGKVKPCTGFQFNFIVRQRIQREDHEEFLFSLHPIFVKGDGAIDETAARICVGSYSQPVAKDVDPARLVGLGPEKAFQTAKAYLQETVKTIWDWNEDVSLLNVALAKIGP